MNLKSLFLTILLFTSFFSIAQHAIEGRVTADDSNEPLIGATIVEAGTSNGTITDIDGGFSLTVGSDQASIVVTYVGYEEQTILINGLTNLDVILIENSTLLDQIVVVGYGVQKKSDLTGAVSSLKGEEIARIPTPNFAQAIQGKIAGVYASPPSGKPGESAVIRIRGTGTLNNSNPLYVIDGMITYDADFLNPQDIESVEVLKDASASAIYGSRGANGVIIITTKSGSAKKDGEITFSAFSGQQEAARFISLLDASEFARAYNQFKNKNFYSNPDSLGVGTDWQREVLTTAQMYNAQLGISGGSSSMTYSLSGNYFKQEGILKNTDYARATLRLNTQFKVNNWLTIGNNAAYSNSKSHNGPNVVTSAYRMPSVLSVRDTLGNFTDPTFFGLAVGNPAADQFYKSNNYSKGNSLLGNLFGEISFLKHFKFRSNYGYDINSADSKYFEPIFKVSSSQLNNNDRLSVSKGGNNNWIWEQSLTYLNSWGKHNVTGLVGYTAEERTSESLGASRENFPGTADELLYLSSGNDTTQMNFGGASAEALNSYLFRTNYSYDSKYLVTVSMRIDQSSRFTEANRTGYFPSIGLGWNLGSENFFQSIKQLDKLKVRASYGILGNQAISNRYPTSAIVNGGLYAVLGTGESINQGATILSLSNPDLKWESSKQTDIGVEISLFGGKFTSEIDWYRRNTYDIIADVPIPDYVGSQNDPFVNTASVINKGWDITLGWRESGKITYSFGANISPISNEVTKLAQGKTEIFSSFINGEPATRTVVGLPIGAFYGYQTDGLFQSAEEIAAGPSIGNEKPGDLKFVDTNLDDIIDGEDRVYLGSPIPTLTYGFNASVEYKGIDVIVDFLGVTGNKVFNEKETFRFGVYNWEKHVADAWTPENTNTEEPRVTNGGNNYRVSDHFIEDGSFFRLRNISLGYTVPAKLISRIKVKDLRFYISGTNLWTKQTFSGYTPEFPNAGSSFSVGFDRGNYPIAKSIQFGLNTKF